MDVREWKKKMGTAMGCCVLILLLLLLLDEMRYRVGMGCEVGEWWKS